MSSGHEADEAKSEAPPADGSSTKVGSPQRHTDLYFPEGNVILQVSHYLRHHYNEHSNLVQVEDILFCLHRSTLYKDPESIFHYILQHDIALTDPSRCFSDDNPIYIADLEAHTFSLWVRVLYAV